MDLNIGNKIDTLYDLRSRRLEFEDQVKEMKSQEAELRQSIIGGLSEQGLNGAKGVTATASIKVSKQPVPTDWDAIYDYIVAHDKFALLHRRISSALWAAIVEEEGDIPGIESMTVCDLSLTKASRK